MLSSATLVERTTDIVHAAGRLIEEIRASADFTVSDKSGGHGPVTEADRRVDALLKRELPALVPAAWLSEETADGAQRLKASRVWIVDPLDGTKEFVAGIPEYAISIALVESGQPTLACIHNPGTGEMYTAVAGAGALLNDTPIRAREGWAVLASRSELKSGEFVPFMAASERTGATRIELKGLGSIAYKLALVAAGRASATLSRGPKWEWDVCAGALLVAEAGGRATDMFGAPLAFNSAFPKVRGIVAGAPGSHDEILRIVGRLGASDRMSEFGIQSGGASADEPAC